MAASKFWQVRCWMDGRTHKRSTKTTSMRAALGNARQFFEHLLLQRSQQHLQDSVISATHTHAACAPPTPSMLFGTAAAQLYANEQARVDRGEFARGSLQVLRNRLDAHILPRFGKTAVHEIDYSQLLAFAQFMSTRYSTTTVSQYLVAVRKVLSLAFKQGQLQKLPEFPKIKVFNTPRAAFTPTEYWRIMRCARGLVGQPHPDSQRHLRSEYKLRKQDAQMTRDLSWAIGFMVNAFLRPSDLRTLQHRHVEVVKHGTTQYLRLTLPETKRHAAPIVTLQPAVRIYQQMLKQRTHSAQAKPSDYLFFPQLKDRNYALNVLGVMFNWVLKVTDLKHSAHGGARSLYSLRHSAITFRLLYGSGIDVLTLARNARTSVEVINKHYASTLAPEQNVRMLHSRRQRPK